MKLPFLWPPENKLRLFPLLRLTTSDSGTRLLATHFSAPEKEKKPPKKQKEQGFPHHLRCFFSFFFGRPTTILPPNSGVFCFFFSGLADLNISRLYVSYNPLIRSPLILSSSGFPWTCDTTSNCLRRRNPSAWAIWVLFLGRSPWNGQKRASYKWDELGPLFVWFFVDPKWNREAIYSGYIATPLFRFEMFFCPRICMVWKRKFLGTLVIYGDFECPC